MMRLTREELQGVVAHEFSHILNGDMRLNMRLIGFVFGLVAITMLGRVVMQSMRYSGRGRDQGGGTMALLALGILLWLVGAAGAFFGRLLQAAISRQREFLADASAVQFTRSPDGLAGALKKVGGAQGSSWRHPRAAEAGHLFFADAGLFSFGLKTHPPLEMRIKALDPSWDGQYRSSRLPDIGKRSRAGQKKSKSGGGRSVRGAGGIGGGRILGGRVMSSLAEEKGGLGESSRCQIAEGRRIREDLPEGLEKALQGRESAQLLIFGMLIAQDRELSLKEIAMLEGEIGGRGAQGVLEQHRRLVGLSSAKKIALMDVALPTLRFLSYEEYRRFVRVCEALVSSDGRVELFEYMLMTAVERHLSYHFERRGFPQMKYRKLRQLADEVQFIVSTMASIGGGETAYEASVAGLARYSRPYVPIESLDLKSLKKALARFDHATPLLKKRLLWMCAQAVTSDGQIDDEECELLRVIGDSIGCAIPPFVAGLDDPSG